MSSSSSFLPFFIEYPAWVVSRFSPCGHSSVHLFRVLVIAARLCPNATGADIKSVCTEAGMYAIRARRKVATEKDFLEAVNKVVKGHAKFSATARYMTYN